MEMVKEENMKRITISFLLIGVLCLFSVPAFAATATLSWTAPTTNTDGTPCIDLAGYNIYSHSGTIYTKIASAPSTTMTYVDQNITVPNNTTITRCYVVTAFDTSNNESGYSNEVCKSFFGADTISPSPPGSLTVK